jgi:lipopolysaccharide transport system ATP-binding protein
MSYEQNVIEVRRVSKRFEIYDNPRNQLKQFILPRLQGMLGVQQRKYYHDFVALNDISLEVRKGESCGIVGLNGSGKSTLLQIITGTLTPSSGTVATQGRIAALLELGSGFNPDFTGRENVYMNGAVLGFSKSQIDAKIEDIMSFADIGEHIDQALSTYSSGMQMRVAFAVATAFDPDILIVDEALAVGDAYFQQKCFQRIEKFKCAGGTLLFVSHDANTVKHLCDKAILLCQGKLVSYGKPRDVIDLYQGMVAQRTDLGESAVEVKQPPPSHDVEVLDIIKNGTAWQKASTVTTNNDAELVDFQILDSEDRRIRHIKSEEELVVQFKVRLNKDFERPAFGIIIRDRIGRSIFETSTYAMGKADQAIAKGSAVVLRFGFIFNLKAGQYSFSIGVAEKGFSRSEFEENSLLMHDVEQIQVLEAVDSIYYGGVFNMNPRVSIEVLK